MDGFNAIPIQNNSSINSSFPNTPSVEPKSNYNSSYVNSSEQAVTNTDIEIVDDVKNVKKSNSFGFLFPLSILCLLGVFAYLGYLVFLRWTTLQQISTLSENFSTLASNLNKEEMEEFVVLDNSLKAINEKLAGHTQLSKVLAFVNKNIRSSVSITDYRMENRENEISVGLVSIAPTLRELAEQTEKMSDLKKEGFLKDFSISQMSLQADGRKIGYTLNLIFDKTKFSASQANNQTN